MCWSYLMPKSWVKWTTLHSEAGLHDRWAALNCGAFHQFDPFKDLQQRVWGRVHHCSQLYRSKGFDIFPSCMFSFLHLCKNKVLFQLDVAVRRSTVLLLLWVFFSWIFLSQTKREETTALYVEVRKLLLKKYLVHTFAFEHRDVRAVGSTLLERLSKSSLFIFVLSSSTINSYKQDLTIPAWCTAATQKGGPLIVSMKMERCNCLQFLKNEEFRFRNHLQSGGPSPDC